MKSSIPAIAFLTFSIATLPAQVIQTEPNDSIGTATPSTLTAGSSGGVASIGNNGDGPYGPTTGDGTGDYDFFSVDANSGQIIVFDVNSNINGTAVDSLIGIYDSTGVLLASNDDDGISRDSFIQFNVPADGTYYLVVGNWISGAGDDAGSLPSDPNTAGTGRGAPGGGIDDYEVVILLDGAAYFTHNVPAFLLGGPDDAVDGDFTLRNEGSSAATITELNISGAGAAAFSVAQPLPLSVPPGGEATIAMIFDPGGSDAVFEASIEIVSDDIIHPNLTLPLSAKAVDGLLFRLPFDDPPGSPTGQFGTPAETSGNDFPAAMVVNAGAPPPVFGRPPLAGDEGFSTMFNDAGSSGNFVLTDNGFPHIATFSYSLWIRPTGGSGEDTLFNRDAGFSLGDTIFGCNLSDTGVINFRINGAEIVASDPGAVPDDTTHHIVVTHLDTTGFGDFEADRTRLFIDGVMVAENTLTFEIPEYSGGSNSRLWIGTRSAAGTGFNGDMDDLQLYNVELDPIEVTELFENPGTVVGDAPRAPFAITRIVRSADGNSVDITFNSRPNRTYILQASDDMSLWEEANDSVESEGVSTTTSFSDPIIFDSDTKEIFFRIVEPE
ncbi:MAG: LamG-like jellyroll fold domain-containing protein [Verrucomicrobiales bacterium]